MTSAYTGIEQVCGKIQSQEERKSVIDERERIANLAIIYMHYNIENMRERIKLFTSLQSQFKEIFFSCMFSDYIRNLASSMKNVTSVIMLPNFRIYMKENSNTIALSQEPYLIDFEGWDCYIEEKLLKNTRLKSYKDMFMVPVLKFKSKILFIPLPKFKKKFNYEPPSILVRIFNLKNQVVPFLHNYLIDVEYIQNFIRRFIKKYSYLKSKIHYGKIDVEVKAYKDLIHLIHETYGDVIRYKRSIMDSDTKEFEQQLMLCLEYLSCSETEEEKTNRRIHNAEKKATHAPV
jgi:hypothetical protein